MNEIGNLQLELGADKAADGVDDSVLASPDALAHRSSGAATLDTTEDHHCESRREDRGYARHHQRRQRRRSKSVERAGRVRLLAASAIGVGCLLAAQALQPDAGSLFAAPAGLLGWLALVCGAVGIWLVPGLWLSAVMVRTGHGFAAWLGCRIGTTLAWYALVGPVIHLAGDGARVTTAAILIPTVAASLAVAIGVALGLSRRPTSLWHRFLVAAAVGAICAQVVIWAWMRLWDFGMNYSHIRALDWLIVLVCALLGTAGTLCRPTLPRVFATRNAPAILLAVLTLGATTAALLGATEMWSPAQRMPSAINIEQVPAPPDADVALAVTAIGPEGNQLVRRSHFTVSDDKGRAVPVSTQLEFGRSADDQATLLVTLDEGSKLVLCGTGTDAGKLTLRDRSSGVLVQAAIPEGWCAR